MDNVLIVTGASRGIGAATANLGAARGYAVCVHYRENHEAADNVVAGIQQTGGRAAEEVAHAILWLLSDEAGYSTGALIDVTGGR